MAVTDTHSNTESKFSDTNKCREEENPQTLFTSPEQGTEKKKKRRKKKSNHQTQAEVCSKPLVDTMIFQIVPQEENAETTAHNSTHKNKKKNELGELQLQTCDPSSFSIRVEPYVTNEEGLQQGDAIGNRDLCSKPLLDTPIPIVPQEGIAEATRQICYPSIPVGVEPDVTNEEGPQQYGGYGNKNLCTTHETVVSRIIEERPVPDSSPLEDTPWKKKTRRKKKSAKTEPKECNDADNPQQCFVNLELKNKMKKGPETNAEQSQVCPKPELVPPSGMAIHSDLELNKTAELIDTKSEHPQACSKLDLASPVDLPTSMNPEKKKEVEQSAACAKLPEPQPCSTTGAEHPRDPTPVDKSKIKRRKKRGREKIMYTEEKVENQGSPLHMDETLNQVQLDPATSICLQPASLDQTILVDPAIPIDTEQKTKKKKRKKRRSVLDGEEPNDNKRDTEQPEIPIQTSAHLIAAPPIDPSIPVDPCPAIPIYPAISTDPEQMSNKKRKKKRKSVFKSKAAEPNEHNSKPPEALPEAPVQESINPRAASSINPIIPIDPATPTEQDQKMNKKRRKKKRKSTLISKGTESSEHKGKPPETPVQSIVYPIVAPSTDPTIPHSATPIDTATPIEQDQKMNKKRRRKKRRSTLISKGTESSEHEGKPPETPVQSIVYPIVAPSTHPTIPDSTTPIDTTTPIEQGKKTRKRKRKRSALISEGAVPNEHDSKLPGTPVQRSTNTIAAPSIDPAIPTGQATLVDPSTPVDPEQMTRKRRKKKRKSALKNEGLESEKLNADLPAETPVQKTEGLTTENSMGMYNAEPSMKTLVQRTDSLRVTKSPFKQHGESSMECWSCRQPGHIFKNCRRLKYLSKNEEVCFFCGEIGHSLGKCSVSHAGGGRFAKCLLCYEHGHFSYNCPRNGHGIDPKVVAANGAINRNVEAEVEPGEDQGRPASEKERTKEIL